MAVLDWLLPDRYVDAEPIGRGGMGQIYRATDTALGRPVAIKILDERYAADAGVRARFNREALAAARLSGNPNTVTIYDVGEYHGKPYLVMECLAGGSLEEHLHAGAVPPQQALEWLEQAATALDAAHREGVVHRDVKPANLLLDRHNRVHVADFGIASAAGLDSLTQTGTVLGTAAYLAPEQAQGRRASPASDIYSLGIVAFELITGQRPFEGETIAAEAAAHVTAELPSICDVNPDAPCELDPVFAKALAKDPAARYPTAAEFVASLRAELDRAAGPTQVLLPLARTAMRARPQTVRRRPSILLPLLALLGLAATGLGLGYALTSGSQRATPPPVLVTTQLRTVAGPTQTIVRTIVTTAAPPAAPATASPLPSSGSDPYAENNRAWALMQQGNYAAALPLLQNAVQQLRGRHDLGTAYANYNLGDTLLQLGRCHDALPYLRTAESLEPSRPEVRAALKQATHC
jgi:eukaryotic-like serine/threonine-protein kinase